MFIEWSEDKKAWEVRNVNQQDFKNVFGYFLLEKGPVELGDKVIVTGTLEGLISPTEYLSFFKEKRDYWGDCIEGAGGEEFERCTKLYRAYAFIVEDMEKELNEEVQ